jgi:PAS domain S-box-containing protein
LADQDPYDMSYDSKASHRLAGRDRSAPAVVSAGSKRSGIADGVTHTLAIDDAYHLLLVENPAPAFVFDPSTLRILATNEAATAFYQYTCEEMRTLTIRDLRPAEDLAALQRALGLQLSGARRVGRWRHRRKDGRVVDVDVEVGPVVFDGVPARFVQVRESASCPESSAIGERRHIALLRSSPEAIIAIDDDARITEFNPAAERLFGYSADEIIGHELTETLIPLSARPRFRQGFANYLATGERQMIGCSAEQMALRADGSEVMVEMTITETPSDDRRRAFIALIREVTEERRLESHLCAEIGVAQAIAGVTAFEDVAEEILHTLCECAGWDFGAVWRVNPQANVLRLVKVWTSEEKRLEQFVGITESAAFQIGVGLPGRVWARQEPIQLTNLEHAEANLPHCRTAGRFGLRTVYACPVVFEGEVLAVLELFSFSDRKPDASFSELMESICAQIAQFLARVRGHERLREANERFEALLDASPLAIFLFDVDLTVRYWNRAAERIFGWTKEEMIGQSYLRAVPEERQGETHRLQQAIVRGEPITGVYATRRRKDGSLVHVILNGAPIHDEHGRVTAIVGLIAEEWDRTDA